LLSTPEFEIQVRYLSWDRYKREYYNHFAIRRNVVHNLSLFKQQEKHDIVGI